ncbi:hypothetical protein [Ralstonia pseudosolanacearum]|uniref:Uncharacterized protein n=1 Tax=Ralstonia solanacearum TaxID=305 RepID=A0A0S4WZ86_RALSL|nr:MULTISPECIES: hypothetical protein [Ralstonia]OHV00328.1 hypothetical protein BLA34_13180 [Ralstonia solanacearum]RAA05034.1 hypothetical protein DOT79_26370 [Ralstonia pseudosolanacearum]UZF17744.1 hypothetical protein LH706_19565 [Ralstonia solanacearum]UZF32516.1 hypothetical protein LGV82_26025 [Ralstonia sp. RS650]CUV56928.1 conserved protein of unknown function [Ralstonia solanacearum]
MTFWNDFNDAGRQVGFDLIPKGTLLKIRMTIRQGGFDDPSRGWTGGWATESEHTGSVYLAAEFVVLEGPYAKRKLWSMIGLHSPKGDEWANMGRAFVRAALNSARGVHPDDNTEPAQLSRRIRDFGELHGMEFIGRVDIELDSRGDARNVIRQAVEPNHKDYAALMAGNAPPANAANAGVGRAHAPAASAPARAAQPRQAAGFTRPVWAQ